MRLVSERPSVKGSLIINNMPRRTLPTFASLLIGGLALSPSGSAAAQSGLKANLLKVAQAAPETSERKFCGLLYTGKKPQTRTQKLLKGYEQQIRAGYFTTSKGTDGTLLTPTAKYLELLKHVKNPNESAPTICFGRLRVTGLSNLRQMNDVKYIADGNWSVVPESWATAEILNLFGPKLYLQTPLPLVFRLEGTTWTAEKR